MKRFIVYCAALVTIAALLTGCTGSGNVSKNTDGMIESSTSRPTTASTAPATTKESTATESESSILESSRETEESGPSARGKRGGNVF